MFRLRPFLISLVALCCLTVRAQAAQRPNVLIILSDDQGWQDHGFMKANRDIRTPNLDKLATQSVVFPRGYVPVPLCRPSLSSLLTGLYPHEHKICCNDPPEGSKQCPAREEMRAYLSKVPTVPRMLRDAGYRCLQTGKFWEGHYRNGGFTDGMTVTGRHGGEGLAIGRDTMQPVYDFLDDCKAKDAPFFLWYAPMMPHTPHNPPERILKKYLDPNHPAAKLAPPYARYWAMCEWFDETCGQVLDYLDKKELADNTIVVYLVDNGWIPNPNDKYHALRSKLTPYDGGIRTPIMIRWPGHIKPEQRRELVSSIDLAPTILKACGLSPTARMPGINLLDVLAGKESIAERPIFAEVFVHTAVDIHRPEANVTHRVVREGAWKLILPTPLAARPGVPAWHAWPVKPVLYNVAKDPTEKNDLADKHPGIIARLTKKIEQWYPMTPTPQTQAE